MMSRDVCAIVITRDAVFTQQGILHFLLPTILLGPFANHVTADHPGYPAYSHLLSDGWIPGRKVVSQQLDDLRGKTADWVDRTTLIANILDFVTISYTSRHFWFFTLF
jgi:hypothetical protein